MVTHSGEKGPVAGLVDAWDKAVVTACVYGGGRWSISYSIIKTIRSWELYYLRKVLRRTYRWNVDRVKLMKESTRAIDRVRQRVNIPHMFHRVATAYMKGWWRTVKWEGRGEEQKMIH